MKIGINENRDGVAPDFAIVIGPELKEEVTPLEIVIVPTLKAGVTLSEIVINSMAGRAVRSFGDEYDSDESLDVIPESTIQAISMIQKRETLKEVAIAALGVTFLLYIAERIMLDSCTTDACLSARSVVLISGAVACVAMFVLVRCMALAYK